MPRCRRTTWKTVCRRAFICCTCICVRSWSSTLSWQTRPRNSPPLCRRCSTSCLICARSRPWMPRGASWSAPMRPMSGSSWRWGGCCHRWRRRRQGCCALAPPGRGAILPMVRLGRSSAWRSRWRMRDFSPSPWCCQRHRSGRWWPPATAITSSTSHSTTGCRLSCATVSMPTTAPCCFPAPKTTSRGCHCPSVPVCKRCWSARWARPSGPKRGWMTPGWWLFGSRAATPGLCSRRPPATRC